MLGKNKNGWEWLEKINISPVLEDKDFQLARTFARCFSSEDGKKVLQHLKKITFERCFGPEVKKSVLKYAEGQRALIAHIETLCKRAKQ